jgi:aspartyl/glutamyl-tRNA(Asn/Gln) amidotransferase C subunit
MAEIVKYVEQLNEIDTESVDPMLGGLTAEGEATETGRTDEPHASFTQDEALSEAPSAVAGHFQVPKVL